MPDESPRRRTSPGDLDDVFAYARRMVGSVEPAIVFSSLVALCVPGFSDFCSADIIEGGRVRYRVAAPRSGGRAPNGRPTDLDAATRGSFELRTTFDSALDGWTPYSGVLVHRWRNHQPSEADEYRAARIVGYAIGVIRDERLADPMRPGVAAPAATFQRARGRR